MESFPSKAVRAFEKPMQFIYAPETGSFCLSGHIHGQRVAVLAGLGATATDESAAFILDSSDMSVADMSNIVTNAMRLEQHLARTEVTPFSQLIPATAGFASWRGEVTVSHIDVGEFILSALDIVHPFTSKDRARGNLQRAQLEMDSEYVTLVSTDGHRLQTASAPYGFVEEGTVTIPVPTKVLDALKLETCLHFEYRTPMGGCVLTAISKLYGIVTVWWQPSSDVYPPWQAAVPDLDDPDRGYGEVPHCLPEFAKLHKGCRKFEMPLYFLAVDDVPIPAFGVMDADMIVYRSSVGEDQVPRLSSYFTISAKYGYELGHVLRKIPEEEIKVHIGADDKPMRVDWERDDLQFTHVLMPKRDSAWPTAE